MKELASRLSYRFVVLMACFALGTVVVGCGDDDTPPATEDAGPDSGAAGRRDSGTSGTGARGGTGGTGGTRAGTGGSDDDAGIEEGMDAG